MSWLRDRATQIYLNDYGRPLAEYLTLAVRRIPRDLDIWQAELKRLQKIKRKTKKQKRTATEYYWHSAFYTGKMVAYLFVIQELGLELKLSEKEIKRIQKIQRRVGKANKGAIPQVKLVKDD